MVFSFVGVGVYLRSWAAHFLSWVSNDAIAVSWCWGFRVAHA